jgi:DNA polymerase III delta subunit
MIYFLYGDTMTAGSKAQNLVKDLLKKRPDASYVKIDEENFSLALLDDCIFGRGLFEQRYIVFMKEILERKDEGPQVLERLEEISKSPNIFIILEKKLDKKSIDKIKALSQKTQEFKTPPKSSAKDSFNVFQIADAFGRGDKKQTWVLFNKARSKNFSGEEIHGILFWQVKSMLLSAQATSPVEAGLSPYVYKKSKDFLKNYTVEDLQSLSSRLVSVYHESRRGGDDINVALEKIILDLS